MKQAIRLLSCRDWKDLPVPGQVFKDLQQTHRTMNTAMSAQN
jgi:hypothetical protein